MTKTAEDHAAYMRQYMNDPEHPERREEKRSYDRSRYQTDPEHRQRVLDRANAHYWDNRDEKREYIARRLRDYKIKAITVLGGACQRCGWNEHPAALQFHHRDPSQKQFTITTSVMGSPKKYPWETVLKEIAKCDLLCANCHFMVESAWDLDGVWPV